MASELRVGTRGSQLALWQAQLVKRRLEAAGAPPCRIVVIATSGDRLQEAPLSDVGGKRLFVKEIEDALLRDEIDLAVHSSKDMPAVLPPGLLIAGVLPREDPLDAIVLSASSHAPSAVGHEPSGMTLEQVVAAHFDSDDPLARRRHARLGRQGHRDARRESEPTEARGGQH